jgi:AraC-like DNA-binding protein
MIQLQIGKILRRLAMIEKTYIDICKREGLNMDIIPYYCGYEECRQGYQFGPLVRDQFILHYIIEGECVLEEDSKIYHLHKNQGFVIFPNTPIYFKVPSREDLRHFWIGFGGKRAEYYLNKMNFSSEHPVYSSTEDMQLFDEITAMYNVNMSEDHSEMELLSRLYRVFFLINSSLKQSNSQSVKCVKDIYVKKAIELISSNYFTKTSIDDIAGKINIDKKYLSYIFKSHYGITPYKLLTDYRIVKAGELLCNPKLSIGEIAHSVGYEDPLHFSRVFKNKKGLSPQKYREHVLKGKEV